MAEEKLLTVREVSLFLGISEKDVMDLAQAGKVPAYKVGGVYLRFKRDQVEKYQKSNVAPTHEIYNPKQQSFQEKVNDFFYFNDFYILSAVLILLIVFIIFWG